jgi:hypothetical protein
LEERLEAQTAQAEIGMSAAEAMHKKELHEQSVEYKERICREYTMYQKSFSELSEAYAASLSKPQQAKNSSSGAQEIEQKTRREAVNRRLEEMQTRYNEG